MTGLKLRKFIVRCLLLAVLMFQLSFGSMNVYASSETQPENPVDDLWVVPMFFTPNGNAKGCN